MTSPKQLARTAFDAATEKLKQCLFLNTPEDRLLYDEAMLMLQAAALLDGAWDRPLIEQCVAIVRKTKRRPPELEPLAAEALRRKESYDALAYLCRAIIENGVDTEALARLEEVQSSLASMDLRNVCNIFLAIAHYHLGDYARYTELIERFRQAKRPDYNPYMAIPASTVRTAHIDPGSRTGRILGEQGRAIWTGHTDRPRCVVSVSCDLTYLTRYAEFFFESFVLTQHQVLCHLALSSGAEEALQELESLSCWPLLKEALVVSCWPFDAAANIGPISASLRLHEVERLLQRYGVPVLTLDFDTVFKAPVAALLSSHPEADVLFRLLPRTAPWEMITGGIVLVRPTSRGQTFARHLAAFLEHQLVRDELQWWVDQNALESAWRAMHESGDALIQHDVSSIRDSILVMPTGKDDAKLQTLSKALMQVMERGQAAHA
jgi:hypothetical protein